MSPIFIFEKENIAIYLLLIFQTAFIAIAFVNINVAYLLNILFASISFLIVAKKEYKFIFLSPLLVIGFAFEVNDFQLYLVYVYLLLMGLYFFVSFLMNQKVFFKTPIFKYILIFFFTLLLSFFQSWSIWESSKELVRWMILIFPLFFTIYTVSDRKLILRFVEILLFVFFIHLIMSFVLPVNVSGRFKGLFENPNTFSIMLQLILPVVFALFITKMKETGFTKYYLGSFLLLGIIVLLKTGSRGGLLTTLISIILILLFIKKYISKKTFYSVTFFLFLFIAFGITFFLITKGEIIHTKGAIGKVEYDTSLVRLVQDLILFKLIKKNLIFGTGLGTFKHVFVGAIGDLDFIFDYLEDSLNSHLQIILETGLIGYTAFLAVMFYVLRSFRKIRKKPEEYSIKNSDDILFILVGMNAAIIGFIIYGNIDMVFYSIGAYLFWVYVGINELVYSKKI